MWNKETEEQMNKFIAIKNKSGKINGTEITILYNLIFNRQVKPTNCASCVSQRFKELKQSFEQYQLNKIKALETIDEVLMEEKITVKKGRPKKNE